MNNNDLYSFTNELVIRTPLFPQKSSFTEDELISFFSKKEAQEALFLSTPVLYSELIKFLNRRNDYKGKTELFNSLLKYALRMHNRCTPFGLFAGCGVIEWSDESNIILKDQRKRSTRMDMHFSCALAQHLEKEDLIKEHLKFFPNTSIYTINEKIRYVEYFYRNNNRVHQISEVDSADVLHLLFKKSKNGAFLKDLIKTLLNEGFSEEESQTFLNEVVGSQLLVSELEPSVTGKDFMLQVELVLKEVEKRSNISLQALRSIYKIQKNIIKIDKKIGNNIQVYSQIEKHIKQFKVPFEQNKLFQTDLSIDFEKHASLNTTIQTQILDCLNVLNKLSPANEQLHLNNFKEEFIKRYGELEMPLLEVLDTENGIGYGDHNSFNTGSNPLVDNIAFPSSHDDRTIKWTEWENFLFKKISDAQSNNEYTVQFGDKDIKFLNKEINWHDLPDSISVMFSTVCDEKCKDLLLLTSAGDSSATNLISRFSFCNDKIEKIIHKISQYEDEINPNALVVEIVHLPENRVGNVLMRPQMRSYEIPYLSKSTLDTDSQISLSDLFIKIYKNQIYLFSKSRNKQVIPKLSNAHNYAGVSSLPVYYFLCDMQYQGIRGGVYFDWGSIKESFNFLPRVVIGTCIVHLATWQLSENQYDVLFKAKKNIMDVVEVWRKEWGINPIVLYKDGDNELLIDFSNILSVNMFISVIKKRKLISLVEFLHNNNHTIVKDSKGFPYTNEFVAAFCRKQIRSEMGSPIVASNKIPKSFLPGSEWLYYKFYCGTKTADYILTELIAPLTKVLLEKGLIDYWFFIRYTDPDMHLRFRLHFSDKSKFQEILLLLNSKLEMYKSKNLIWKVNIDEYEREVERYGESTMMISEKLFYHDSQFVTSFLNESDDDDFRWLFSIKAIDVLLNDFYFSFVPS